MGSASSEIIPPERPASSLSNENAPFQLRGASLTLLTLKLADPSDAEFFPRLQAMLALAPGFYRNAPIILELSAMAGRPPMDLGEFCRRLRQLALKPVGFQRADEAWTRAAQQAGLPAFPAGRATEASAATPVRGKAVRATGTRLVTEPVRSGQQVYAHKGDLIVLAPVSHGAELLADGNIHVYGPLRGRALAGMSGDKSARIFCRALDADLVSVAGTYLVSEQLEPARVGQPAQVRLEGEQLIVEQL